MLLGLVGELGGGLGSLPSQRHDVLEGHFGILALFLGAGDVLILAHVQLHAIFLPSAESPVVPSARWLLDDRVLLHGELGLLELSSVAALFAWLPHAESDADGAWCSSMLSLSFWIAISRFSWEACC